MLKNINKLIKNEHNLITLIGMMGTGKTKFGNLVARELDYNFYDSDVLIEKKISLTIETNNNSETITKLFSAIGLTTRLANPLLALSIPDDEPAKIQIFFFNFYLTY